MANEEPELPEVVYHYTSTDAMIQIVENKSIWATAISYLNDKTERQYVIDAVEERLPARHTIDESVPASLVGLNSQAYVMKPRTLFAREPFVASFSARRDSLLHWRAYCPQQSGVAIGFRTKCLNAARIDEQPREEMVGKEVSFGQVSYLDTSDQEIVDRLIGHAKLIATIQTDLYHDAEPQPPFSEFFRWAVEAIACSSKHSSFESEVEYRLMLFGIEYRENNLKFRTVRSTLVPYVPLHIPNQFEATGDVALKAGAWDAIADVIIGPTTNIELTERAVKSFFGLKRMDVNVLQSKVPYRDW